MKGKHFVVFAYGSEFSHIINAPEVVVITGDDYLSVYTSYRSYANSKPIKYSKIQDEMALIIDNGGILILKNLYQKIFLDQFYFLFHQALPLTSKQMLNKDYLTHLEI